MKKLFGLFLFFAILLSMPSFLAAAESAPVLQSSTIGVVYIDAAQLFSFYSGQAAELVKPENAGKLAEIEKQFKGYARLEVSLSDYFKKIAEFASSSLFIPDGQLWFTIDTSYRPTLAFKAKVKPLEFLEFLESHLGKLQQQPLQRQKDLVEYRIPAPDFDMVLSIRPDGVYLQSDGISKDPEDKVKWADLLKNVSAGEALISAEVDLAGIKNLLAGKSANVQHGVCFSNLRMLSAALEMYALDKEAAMKTLDQKQLKADHYLNDELICPNGGNYSLNAASEVECTAHGTIKNPGKAETVSSAANIPEQFRPFETFRIKVLKNHAEAALKLNDKNLVEQWVAIGKQQLLTIKNVAQNQMGQLPEAERQKGLKMLEAVKINQDDLWLRVSVEGLDEKTILSGLTGFVGAMSAIAVPNFTNARNKARESACRANRRILSAATEMYELDAGKTSEKLDIDTLVGQKYIKTMPNCPDGGTYSLTRDKNGFSINCSHHQQD